MKVYSDGRCTGSAVSIGEMLLDPPRMHPPWTVKTIAGAADDGQLEYRHIARRLEVELRERLKRRHREMEGI
jgi:hypothetical protein